MRLVWIRDLALSAAAVLAAIAIAPRPAHACGGFFCNNAAPINQAGERIVFAVEEDGTVVTHVQILYSGPAEQFAWILPVPAVPTLSPGTDVLFERLDAFTAPRFALDYRTTGTCREEPRCWDDRGVPGSGGGAVDAAAFADGGASGGVTVHFMDAVGPYDAVVLSSGDAMTLRTWLADNGYDIPAPAGALLDDYVAQGDYFVALKLQQDRGTGEIQPIVLRYRELQPCIPIRLTAIATVPDMPITAWVLGRSNAQPFNYPSVEPDLDVPDLWIGGGRNYQMLVSDAVDAAGGRAWVTEFAGATPEISISMPGFDHLRTVTDPQAFVSMLVSSGLRGDAQLLALLTRFIPPPDGEDPRSFYNCLVNEWCSTYDGYLSTLAFDPSAFVDELHRAIVDPRNEAHAMVARHANLTRFFTTMSADEMTIDPTFKLSPDALDVSNVHTATLTTECSSAYFHWTAPQKLALPSGRELVLREGIPYFGTDSEYCADYESGVFAPWTDPEIARATAMRRGVEPRGGGLCSTSAGAAGRGAALVAVGITALGLALRRRRRSR